MKDGMFIFDAVIHRFDFRPSNPKLKPPIVDGYIDWVRGLVDGMATEGNPGNPDAFVDGKLDELSEANFLFDNSDTDMAMVQTVPLLDYWEVGSRPRTRRRSWPPPSRTRSCSVVAWIPSCRVCGARRRRWSGRSRSSARRASSSTRRSPVT